LGLSLTNLEYGKECQQKIFNRYYRLLQALNHIAYISLFSIGINLDIGAMFKTVLFPLDTSSEAQQAAHAVFDLAQVHQSRVVLLSVVEPPTTEGRSNHPEQSSPEAVAQLLAKAKTLFAEQGLATETLEREGKPAFVICDVADELAADLIIMGCRGIGLTEEGQSDSVTARVINLAPCPVLIVP
jgi:nucleotide-binding universal stress UspA family protein